VHSDIVPEHDVCRRIDGRERIEVRHEDLVLEVQNQVLLPAGFNVGDHRPAGDANCPSPLRLKFRLPVPRPKRSTFH
jgi:hypothetical protein